MFKTILIPIDISQAENANAVIDVAAANASSDAQIILLNVVEEIPNWAAVELPEGIREKSIADSQEVMNKVAKEASVKASFEVRVGHAYQTILEVAEEKNAGLIVIASHKPGLQDYLLGSTAAKVVRHARCSVLVIR